MNRPALRLLNLAALAALAAFAALATGAAAAGHAEAGVHSCAKVKHATCERAVVGDTGTHSDSPEIGRGR
jgi:hypothetical protein